VKEAAGGGGDEDLDEDLHEGEQYGEIGDDEEARFEGEDEEGERFFEEDDNPKASTAATQEAQRQQREASLAAAAEERPK
jgi:hypothetical protein